MHINFKLFLVKYKQVVLKFLKIKVIYISLLLTQHNKIFFISDKLCCCGLLTNPHTMRLAVMDRSTVMGSLDIAALSESSDIPSGWVRNMLMPVAFADLT